MRPAKVVTRNFIVFWRAWRFSFLLSVLGPVMFLSAMGLGLGSLVREGDTFGGVSYLAFFATGMLTASAMQAGVFTATYPVMAKIVWQRNYEAILATPLSVRDVYIGELMWIGVVLCQISIPFFAVMAAFGIFEAATSLLAIPIVVLVGVACAAVVLAFTATLQIDEAYTWLFRLVVTPLFLMSGTFFPIADLPAWGRALAQATPLFHGVELVRQVTLFDIEASALWHLGYLVVLLGLGVAWGFRTFEARLRP